MAEERHSKSYISMSSGWDGGEHYPGAFSATDIRLIVSFPDGVKKASLPIAGIKISTHRDKFPVYSMPHINARGFTQGHRTIAGTLIFNTLDRFAFHSVQKEKVSRDGSQGGQVVGLVLPDQLPLFDVYLTYVNEQGMASFESIMGLTILDMSRAMSLEDLQPMEVYSFMALDYIPLSPLTHETPPEFKINNINGDRKSINSVNSTLGLGRTNLTNEYDP